MSEDKAAMADSTFGDKTKWSLLPNSNPNVATEDHLQSLGFNVNNGLPKFRLNEPGPAALASSIFQQNNMNINDETEQSFVVLGHTSLESIREASLASYMEIQQKCADTDHTCSISMMSPTEVQENLKNVLEENIKLKETLKQNNIAMKQQFNTITMWQKEVMTVCDNHKQKFLETKELISRLKKENDELREKIAKNQEGLSEMSNTSTLEENIDDNSLLKKSSYASIENIPTFPNLSTECLEGNKENNDIQSQFEKELMKRINSLSEELNKVQVKHSETKQILQELENRYVTDIDLFSQQLQKANKELDTFKQKSDSSTSPEIQALIDKCCEKDIELTYLKEIISSLQQQVKKLEENQLNAVDLQIELSDETMQEKQKLKENVEFYNQKLEELSVSFASQCARYLKIQQLFKESTDIIRIFENANILSNTSLSEDEVKNYKNKLCEYRKKLIDEQLQNIDDKQTTIKVQKQFRQILSDYNSAVYELEILKDDNLKLMTMQTKAAEENSKKLEEIEKYLDEEKKMLDTERNSLLEERLNIQLEKKRIIEEREIIKAERSYLVMEKERLVEEKTSLLEEKTSLDLQSKLYEAEEGTLHKEKKFLQKRCEALKNQIDNLKAELDQANDTIGKLRLENHKLKENEGIISAYKIQTEMREKQFEEMQSAQRNLQDQLQSLSMANLQLRGENNRPGGQQSGQNTARQARYCSFCAKYISPEENHGMGICTPEFD